MRLDAPATIGVISDTHGSLNPAVAEAFRGVDLIVHAGDIGGQGLVLELETIAPVVAVRGNTDTARWALDLPLVASVRVGLIVLRVAHDATAVAADGASVVVSGHTHRPAVEQVRGVLRLNPGSASEPRTPVRHPTVALLHIAADGHAVARISTL